MRRSKCLVHPRHWETATSAVLEAEGRTLVLSARRAESASYTQEMGHTAVGGHGNKKQLVPLLQGILLF